MVQTELEKIFYPIDYHKLLTFKNLPDCILKVIFDAHFRGGGISCGAGFLFPTTTIGVSSLDNPIDPEKIKPEDLTLEDSVVFEGLTPYIYERKICLHPDVAPNWYSNCFVPSFFKYSDNPVFERNLVFPGGDGKLFTMDTLVQSYKNIKCRDDFTRFKQAVAEYKVAYERLISPFS